MNPLVIKIMAVGLTLSQLFTKPVEQFRTSFNPDSDQAQVEQIMHDGCQYMLKEFGAEKIDFDLLFTMMISNIKAAQERAGGAQAPVTDQKFTSTNLTDSLDIPTMYAAYKEFCKNEKPADAPIALGEVISYYNKTLTDLPDPATLKGKKLLESTLVLDPDGQRFSEIYADNNRRRWVPIGEIPDVVQKAFVAAEDKRFFQHHGLDIRGIIRAFASSVSSSRRPQGGSTITQQVAKNLLVGDDLTFERKIREMIVAARLEKVLSKQEILELYLNFVFLGRTSWGVDMAAQSYFGKPVKQLNLAEAAILAGMTKGPNYYSPELHADRLQERREYVLSRMKEDGYIQDAAFQGAVAAQPKLAGFESPRTRAAFYFLDEIQRDARQAAGLESLTSGSYVVRSTIHRELQKVTETAVQDGLEQYELSTGRNAGFQTAGSLADPIENDKLPWQDALQKAHANLFDVHWPLAVVLETGKRYRVGLADGRVVPIVNASSRILRALGLYDLLYVQINENQKSPSVTLRMIPEVEGAAVVLETKTGRVLAMTGGFSYAESQLNRVTRSPRQPGSTLKPFIYLSALNLGFQPNTLVPDAPVELPPIERGGQWWSPHNYDEGMRGLVTIREAVEQSLNLPTARMMTELGKTPMEGLDYIRGVTQELGIYQQPVRVYPFVLGAQPTRLIDLAVAYATIANIGLKPTAHFIDSIEQNSKSIYQRPRSGLQPLNSVDRVSFYQIRRILEGTVARGTAYKLKDLAGFVAGKTGTSNNFNDSWFVGFTNDLVVAVWVGYDSRNVKSSLGNKSTGARVALPIAEKILRASFDIYKAKQPLAGPPAEIQSQIVEYPIDHDTGEFNAGGFMEAFRADRPGVPRNTMRAILRGGEEYYAFRRPGDDEGMPDYGYGGFGPYPPPPYGYGPPRDAYMPGADDMYDYWRRRNRRIDGFFQNPYFFRN
jgi:1A family penicillin-binding protein